MYKNSKNKQVVYSLDTLSDSLYRLLLNKPFSEITVTEICNNCDITRKTFYRNCDDIYDLIDYRMDQEIINSLESISWYHSPTPDIVLTFFRYWEQRKPMLTMLYRKGLFTHFKGRVLKICTQYDDYRKITSVIGQSSLEEKEYYDAFVIGGIIQLMESWISHGFDLSAEQVTNVFLLFKQSDQNLY